MKNWLFYPFYIFVFAMQATYISAEMFTGIPLKYISGCMMDFNKDDTVDIALLVEAQRGWELIILLNTTSGYNGYVATTEKHNMYLSCHVGKTIKGTSSGVGKKDAKIYNTNGTYIQLTQPEGSSVVYFWEKNGFKEVWTSD